MVIRANTPAERRRHQRQLEIQVAACRLVLERGYDGFTMDDLAEAVGVSRRTLFNLAQDKASSVLGPAELEQNALIEDFRNRPPSDHLLVELLELVVQIVDEVEELDGDDPKALECHQLMQQAVAEDPHVARMVNARFAEFAEIAVVVITQRQGWPADDLRAHVLASTALGLVQLGLERLSPQGDPGLPDIFREITDLVRGGLLG